MISMIRPWPITTDWLDKVMLTIIIVSRPDGKLQCFRHKRYVDHITVTLSSGAYTIQYKLDHTCTYHMWTVFVRIVYTEQT